MQAGIWSCFRQNERSVHLSLCQQITGTCLVLRCVIHTQLPLFPKSELLVIHNIIVYPARFFFADHDPNCGLLYLAVSPTL
jgi:hypothetical protein